MAFGLAYICAPMSNTIKIALIREGKTPPDRRVAFEPSQCREMEDRLPIQFIVEPSPIRCFKDQEYITADVAVSEQIQEADYFFGIKEVPIHQLHPGKTYFFFSHTVKKQPHNRALLQAVLAKNIRLIDYELLTDQNDDRVVAFGYYAGVVGAHNAMYAYGKRTGGLRIPRMKYLHDYAEAQDIYRSMKRPTCNIVVAGKGRVGRGVVKVLNDMGFTHCRPSEYLVLETTQKGYYTVLGPEEYVQRKDGTLYDRTDFYTSPENYQSAFLPYAAKSDIFINAILWKQGAPAFFTLNDMQSPNFHIGVIADITCDIAPITSVPSTIRASTIDDPVFGFDPVSGKEIAPYQPESIDMMTIDNLPSELPRDASTSFGAQLIEYILPELLEENSVMLDRATIARNGQLTPQYAYLQDFVDEGL